MWLKTTLGKVVRIRLQERYDKRYDEYRISDPRVKEENAPFVPDPIEGFEDLNEMVEEAKELEREEHQILLKVNMQRMRTKTNTFSQKVTP